MTKLIQNPPRLREALKKMYNTHVTEHITAVQVDPDVKKEYERQKEYLEESMSTLMQQHSKTMGVRHRENMRVMQENVALIKEINTIRREIKSMRQVQRQKDMYAGGGGGAAGPGGGQGWGDQGAGVWDEQEARKIMDMQRAQIETMRRMVEDAKYELFAVTGGSEGVRV